MRKKVQKVNVIWMTFYLQLIMGAIMLVLLAFQQLIPDWLGKLQMVFSVAMVIAIVFSGRSRHHERNSF